MILRSLYKLLLISFFFLANVNSYSQNLPLVEISDKKKEMYQSMLEKNRKVVSFIENTLVQNGLPKMMRNLALIESHLDKNTVSSAKAVGIWQFMEAHAAQYGLESEKRSDVYHSTQTAMKSLKNLYNKYGNWITVVAAYNCGEGNVSKAMSKAGSERYEKFYTYLPSETINHVRKFMEACIVTDEFDFLLTDYKLSTFNQNMVYAEEKTINSDPSLTSTDINAAYDLDVIAEEMEIKLSDLKIWNPDIDKKLLTEGVAKLYLPIDKMPDFLLLKNTILDRSLETTTYND
jgi:membrane-bound lytic murein transglycosylase D